MIDYKKLDLVYDLIDKFKEIHRINSSVSMKLGSHPSICEFKLCIEHDEGDQEVYIHQSIDELIDRLESFDSTTENNHKFSIGQTIWFSIYETEVHSMTVDRIEASIAHYEYIYFNNGFYIQESRAYASKKELIEAQIQKWLEMLKETECEVQFEVIKK